MEDANGNGSVLFRFYEIPQFDLGESISINTNSQSAVKPRDLRSNDKYMRALKIRYETRIPSGYFITKRGEERPADKDPKKCISSPDYARMVCAWMCQRPNLIANEARLFDEHYKTLFHTELDPESMLTLNLWLNAIDSNWPLLAINDAVKAVRGTARFHMLFIVSQLFAQASNQTDRTALPVATAGALTYQAMILGQAQQCLNQALNQAIGQSVAAGRVFSPQNWLKSRGAVNDEQLVAGTIVSVLRGLNSPDLAPMLASLTLPPDKFSFRWSAE